MKSWVELSGSTFIVASFQGLHRFRLHDRQVAASQGRDPKKSQCCIMHSSRKQYQCSAKHEVASYRWLKTMAKIIFPHFVPLLVAVQPLYDMPPDETEPPSIQGWLQTCLLLFYYTMHILNKLLITSIKRHYFLLVLSVTLSMLLTVLCIMCCSNVLQNTKGLF